MILFPNAKINLGLYITGKRADGYHLLDTVFYPIPLKDIIEFRANNELSDDTLTVNGNVDTGKCEDNLVLKAVRKMREATQVPYLEIQLTKAIPSGAGMGGGSADASFMLKGLRDAYAPQIDNAQLKEIALSLGADCPFFIDNTASEAQGIGEILHPMPHLNLKGYYLIIVKPDLHISTAEAFHGLPSITPPLHSAAEIARLPIAEWKGRMSNVFEDSLFPQYPILGELKDMLYRHRAVYASMTGSGSALYALCTESLLDKISEVNNCFVWEKQL